MEKFDFAKLTEKVKSESGETAKKLRNSTTDMRITVKKKADSLIETVKRKDIKNPDTKKRSQKLK